MATHSFWELLPPSLTALTIPHKCFPLLSVTPEVHDPLSSITGGGASFPALSWMISCISFHNHLAMNWWRMTTCRYLQLPRRHVHVLQSCQRYPKQNLDPQFSLNKYIQMLLNSRLGYISINPSKAENIVNRTCTWYTYPAKHHTLA